MKFENFALAVVATVLFRDGFDSRIHFKERVQAIVQLVVSVLIGCFLLSLNPDSDRQMILLFFAVVIAVTISTLWRTIVRYRRNQRALRTRNRR